MAKGKYPRAGKCGCTFVTRRAYGNRSPQTFPFTANGLTMALSEADFKYGSIDIVCDGEEMQLASCTDDAACHFSPSGNFSNKPLADLEKRPGSKKRKKRRERRKVAKADQTPQQKKFARAAAKCKGKPGYRQCVRFELKKD